MAIATVVTRGYGNGTLVGTIALVVVRGYALPPVIAYAISVLTTGSAPTTIRGGPPSTFQMQ